MSDNPLNEADEEIIDTSGFETNDSISNSEIEEQTPVESEVQVDEAAIAKQKSNDAFSKQYGENKRLERDLAFQRQENAKFKQAEHERQALQIGEIPPMPDAFDDDFEVKVKQRDDAIIARTNFNASNQAYLQQEQFNQQQAAQARTVKTQEVLQGHSDRAAALGIKPAEMLQAENAVLQYGLNPDLLAHIAGMEDSPLVIKHLATNAQDGYDLASMSPYNVTSFLDGIKTKAGALKPKTSNTPKPATNLRGNGVDPSMGKHKYIDGATFE